MLSFAASSLVYFFEMLISYIVFSSISDRKRHKATVFIIGNRFVKGRLPWSYTFFFFELLSRRLSPRP